MSLCESLGGSLCCLGSFNFWIKLMNFANVLTCPKWRNLGEDIFWVLKRNHLQELLLHLLFDPSYLHVLWYCMLLLVLPLLVQELLHRHAAAESWSLYNHFYCDYSLHTRMQLAHVSHGQFKAPTWKERCALDEAQRALFREGPSRAAELRKSCAAQTKTWKRRKGGRGKRDKKTWTVVSEWVRRNAGCLLSSDHLRSQGGF